MIRNNLALFLLLFWLNLASQNKQLLYNFAEIPQTLLLNPGAETNYNLHVGIPLLSGFSMNLGATEVTLADVFSKDGVPINTKLRNAFDRASLDDFLFINNQIEILNAGFRIGAKSYISLGFYTELDVFSSFPKDIVQLAAEGNSAFLNKSFSLSQVNVKADVTSVFHVGFTRKKSENFTFGGRLKVYSGVANVQTSQNSGTFTTTLGRNSIYEHHLNSLNATVNSSSVFGGEEGLEGESIIKNLYNFSNLGLGVDVGFTYHFSPQEEITASILDLGFVNYKNNIQNKTLKGSYSFSGIDFLFDETNRNYLEDIENEFNEKVKTEEDIEPYTVLRPIKFNTSYKYSWGRSRSEKSCYDTGYKEYYNNAVGGQLYAVTTPLGAQFALTGFYEKNFGKLLKTKFTYTVDSFSKTNVGIGFASNIGAFNVYGMVDNVLDITDIADSNYVSFQFGFNLIFR